MFTSFPANLSRGNMPAVQAVCVLFDGFDGRPLAVIDGTEVTHWRTAADSALATKFLAPPNPETMLVVGAGEMSRWLVRAHRTVRPSLQRVLVWNRTAERASEVAKELAREGIEAVPISDLDAATRAADLITTLYSIARTAHQGHQFATRRPPRPGRRLHPSNPRGR
ncbi:hypothetical protein [Bradyrhizobium sp. AUGA SZCCT0431]|uniref:hypothetical protein n=1 Tax=Bradyrhizobium sp. AUGA SZCCT0431 TaxID=2807674 RepID=UPI0024C0AD17|nr:hypothetical protein [Bradyrhizobium sp. AUGA SZCCT0431]